MTILGLVFSNIHNKEFFELTEKRTIASVPIGGRYRLIDFTLSNLVNAGVTQVGVITKNNYQSLMEHIGSGKEWDLARKQGGLVILPPYSICNNDYNTRLEAIKSVSSFINHSKAEYVIITDCYHLCNIDYKDVLKYHISKKADITCVYRICDKGKDIYFPINSFYLDEEDRITKMNQLNNFDGKVCASANIWILKRELLQSLILEAINTNYHSFNRDLLEKNLNNLRIYGYNFKGYFGNIHNLRTYFDVSKDLLKDKIREELFNTPSRSIYTKVRDSAPTIYKAGSKVSNSLIADGCIIEGEVYNSIIFRGAKIEKGAIIEDCILMQDTIISNNVTLKNVITDKNVQIKFKKELCGTEENPVYINKNGVL